MEEQSCQAIKLEPENKQNLLEMLVNRKQKPNPTATKINCVLYRRESRLKDCG